MSDQHVEFGHGTYRRLYAGATKGRRINSVPAIAELVFWRAHFVCDDFGTFEADPYLFKIQAFPIRRDITEAQVANALEQIEAARLVSRYTVNGERYGQIADFEKFQPAGRNGKRYRRHPAPPSECAPVIAGESGCIQGNPGEAGGIPVNPGEPSGNRIEQNRTEQSGASAHAEARPLEHKPKPTPKPKPANTGPHAALVDHFCTGWSQDHQGARYPFNRGKDGDHFKRILAAVDGDLARAKAIVDAYLRDADPFYIKNGHTAGCLVSNLPKFIAARTRPAPALTFAREDN